MSPGPVSAAVESSQLAKRGERLGATVIDIMLLALTLYVGWLIWFAIIARHGQTPGKRLVGLRVVRHDGRAVGAVRTALREVLFKWILFYALPYGALATWVELASGSGSAGEAGPILAVLAVPVFALGAIPVLIGRRRRAAWDWPLGTTVGRVEGAGSRRRAIGAIGAIGATVPDATVGVPSAANRLRQLGALRAEGLITQQEFEQMREQLLERL